MEALTLAYHLCPTCRRAVPNGSAERYCPNDGSAMLTACPHCQAAIRSPYSQFCSACGEKLVSLASEPRGER